MGAIAATQVSLYPTDLSTSEYHSDSVKARTKITRRLKITGVTAADTATAAVLGLSSVISASSGYNGTTPGAVAIGVDPVNNEINVGAGPNNETLYLVVTGTPKTSPG